MAKLPTVCAHCNGSMTRGELAQHVSRCARRSCGCTAAADGCAWSGLLVAERPGHEATCAYAICKKMLAARECAAQPSLFFYKDADEGFGDRFPSREYRRRSARAAIDARRRARRRTRGLLDLATAYSRDTRGVFRTFIWKHIVSRRCVCLRIGSLSRCSRARTNAGSFSRREDALFRESESRGDCGDSLDECCVCVLR